MEKSLPGIPDKRYFTIGEVSDLCGVKPYVLRYWEQEFAQLKPMKRRGNRRYYQHHEVVLIRRIRELLYEEGFTISGARNQLSDAVPQRAADADERPQADDVRRPPPEGVEQSGRATFAQEDDTVAALREAALLVSGGPATAAVALPVAEAVELPAAQLRAELVSIRDLLTA